MIAALLPLLAVAAAGVEDEWVNLRDPFAEASDAGASPDAVVIESFESAPDAGAAMAIESFEAPSPSPVHAGPRLRRTWTELRGLVAVDTGFEPPPANGNAENVVELRSAATLGADVELADRVRLVVEAQARWRAVAQSGFARAKAVAEARVGDAFVDWYGRFADVRVGWQRVALGANALLAPADGFNPRDLRDGFMFTSSPDAAVISTFAVRAQGEVGPLHWLAAYAPFFQPSRYSVFGQDEAFLQPAATTQLPLHVDPNIEDGLQEHLLETSRPSSLGLWGDLALRGSFQLGRAHVGAGWLWRNERLPQVRVDPELALAIRAQSIGAPVDPAVLLSLQNRLGAGETLYSADYARQHLFWVEGSALAGPVQLDADVAFTPARTFFTDRFGTIRRPSWTWVVGASPAEDSDLTYSAAYVGMAVPSVAADDLIFLLEPSTARGAERVAWFHLFVLAGAYRPIARLEVALALALEPIQGSWLLAPQVSYEVLDRLFLGVGAAVFSGRPTSPFGYYDRNDQVQLTFSWAP